MSKQAKLQTLASDERSWAHIATDFLLEIKEHIEALPKSVSNASLVARIDYFLLHDKLPPKVN